MGKEKISLLTILVGSLLGLLFLLVGVTVGHWWGSRSANEYETFNVSYRVLLYGTHADALYSLGRDEEAREALLNYIRMLEELEEKEHPILNKESIAFEIMQSWARLALVAERKGDLAGRDGYFARALSRAAVSGKNVKSEDDLRRLMKELDAAQNRAKGNSFANLPTWFPPHKDR